MIDRRALDLPTITARLTAPGIVLFGFDGIAISVAIWPACRRVIECMRLRVKDPHRGIRGTVPHPLGHTSVSTTPMIDLHVLKRPGAGAPSMLDFD